MLPRSQIRAITRGDMSEQTRRITGGGFCVNGRTTGGGRGRAPGAKGSQRQNGGLGPGAGASDHGRRIWGSHIRAMEQSPTGEVLHGRGLGPVAGAAVELVHGNDCVCARGDTFEDQAGAARTTARAPPPTGRRWRRTGLVLGSGHGVGLSGLRAHGGCCEREVTQSREAGSAAKTGQAAPDSSAASRNRKAAAGPCRWTRRCRGNW
jgi:hypothetical protein